MTNRTAPAYDPLSEVVQRDPYRFYAALRADSPVAYVDSLQAYAVSRHADVRRVMHDHETFSSEAMAALVSRPGEYATELREDASMLPVSIVGTDDGPHTRLRLIVNRAFTPKRIGMIEEDVRRVARGLVDALIAAEAGDVQSGLAVPLPTIIISAMLGIPAARRDDFRRWSEDMVRGVFEPLDGAGRAQVLQSSEEMGEFLDEVIAARSQKNTGDDMISLLLRAEVGQSALTRDEVKVFVFTLLVAGSITTAYLIGTTAQMLADDPNLLARARAGAMPAIVEETLRFDTPVQLMFRTATTAVEVAGTTIPRGATVLALLGSANRDSDVFVEPDHFDPDRDTTEHLSFGHGVHFCLGAALARQEARIALEELVARAPRLEVAGTVERVSSIVFRGPTRLPVRFV
jgi:cytochrome P450